MKFLNVASFAFTVLVSFAARAEIKTVPYVDVSRYLGTWYNIARNPMFFEGECFCSQQKLGLKPSGNVSVYNSCNRERVNGPLAEISGEAVVADKATNAKLIVDFNIGRKGEYWIIALDSDYRYAVVTDSRGYTLYVLSKTPTLAPELYQEAVAKAAEQVSTSRLELMQHAGCNYP